MPKRAPARRRTFTNAYCPHCHRLIALETSGEDLVNVHGTFARHHESVPESERHTRDIRTMPWCKGSGALVVKPSGAKSEDQR